MIPVVLLPSAASELVDHHQIFALCVAQQNRLVMTGLDLRISPKSALALSLALHKLATNAVKYSAWSNDHGLITLEWAQVVKGEKPVLEIVWKETGGPPVAPPARSGFGSRLIQRGLAGELGGKVDLRFEAEGLTCRIEAP